MNIKKKLTANHLIDIEKLNQSLVANACFFTKEIGRLIGKDMSNLCLYASCDERSSPDNAYVWVYKHLITGMLYEITLYLDDALLTAEWIPYSDEFLFKHLNYTSNSDVFNTANRKRKIGICLAN
ncbi:hypothetical protein C8N40_110127 [Pontibacter mucosus]|uniref:Uncharacterized protein n=1 Tax=Pontibacter mucosus TaxID=1649266 RepID=A0A2T5YDV3_9BACT|nr:hypothetical protein C8N40_110127 [Pontibacter mucosus]